VSDVRAGEVREKGPLLLLSHSLLQLRSLQLQSMHCAMVQQALLLQMLAVALAALLTHGHQAVAIQRLQAISLPEIIQ